MTTFSYTKPTKEDFALRTELWVEAAIARLEDPTVRGPLDVAALAYAVTVRMERYAFEHGIKRHTDTGGLYLALLPDITRNGSPRVPPSELNVVLARCSRFTMCGVAPRRGTGRRMKHWMLTERYEAFVAEVAAKEAEAKEKARIYQEEREARLAREARYREVYDEVVTELSECYVVEDLYGTIGVYRIRPGKAVLAEFKTGSYLSREQAERLAESFRSAVLAEAVEHAVNRRLEAD